MKRVVLSIVFSILSLILISALASALWCNAHGADPKYCAGNSCVAKSGTWVCSEPGIQGICDWCDTWQFNSAQGDGNECNSDSDCAPAPSCVGGQTTGSVSCNQAPTEPNTPNTFTTGSCDGTTPCQYACPSGDYYDGSTGSCETPVNGIGEGGSCNPPYRNCGNNLQCGSDGICHTTTTGGVGGSCTWWGTCQSGLYCTDGRIAGNTGTCQQWDVPVGGACDSNRLCDGSGTCSGGLCKNYNVGPGGSCDNVVRFCANTDMYACTGGTCTAISYSCTGPQASDSAICPGDDGGLSQDTPRSLVNSCGSAKCEYTCLYGKVPSGGSCKVPEGGGCNYGGDCVSGFCDSNADYKCSTITNCGGTMPSGTGVNTGMGTYSSQSPPTHTTWTYDPYAGRCEWACNTGYYQNGNTCSLKKANGVDCTANGQCTSGTCSTTTNKCSGGTATCDATNCATWSACSGGSQSCSAFNAGCTVPSTAVTRTCSAPTINSFSVTPSTVTAGNSVTFSGTVTAGNACITRDRARVVGSTEPADGGWTTRSGCPQSITLSGTHSTASNIYSFYRNPGTYTVRWEVESVAGTATRDASVTVNSGNCTPTTCAAQGKNCGSISDGCGGTLNCGTCTNSQICGTDNICTTNTQFTCTGPAPGNAGLCSGDDTGLTANTARTLASSCGSPKCQYTCTAPYVYSGSGATATCTLPSALTTVSWKAMNGNTITQADLNDRVVMTAGGSGFTGKKVVFTVYKSVTGFDQKLNSFTVTPESDTFATYNATMNTQGTIYFKANSTASDDVTSSNLIVSGTPGNDPPIVSITSPISGGIYFVNNPILFNQTSSDPDSSIQSRLWTLGDGTTSTNETLRKAYTSPGQKTITLKVTDEQGASTTKQVSIIVSASPSIFSFVEQPAYGSAVVSPNFVVDYSGRQSYLVNVTYSGTPCTTTVNCLAGNCPTQTQQSPVCAADPGAKITVANGGQQNYNFNTLMFNWTFKDGAAYLSPEAAAGKVSGTKGFSSAGQKNITIRLKYSPTGSAPIESTYNREFLLLNQRQCSPDGATWYSISNGFVTGTSSTLNTASCAGLDLQAGTNDDCCPAGFTCSTSATNPGCKVDSAANSGCGSYTTQASCTADASQRVRSDILWSYSAYNCGKSVNGRNYACACAWTGSACVFNASSRYDDNPINGGTTSCTYTSTTGECVSGYQSVTITAQTNNVGGDPLCVDSIQTIPCGRPVVALPFVGIPQIIAAILLIAIIYAILHNRKHRKRK